MSWYMLRLQAGGDIQIVGITWGLFNLLGFPTGHGAMGRDKKRKKKRNFKQV